MFSSNSSSATCLIASLYLPCVFSNALGPNEQPVAAHRNPVQQTTAQDVGNRVPRIFPVPRICLTFRPAWPSKERLVIVAQFLSPENVAKL
jgi:hypothetical protein